MKEIRDRVLMPLYLLIGFVLIFSKVFNIEKNTFIIIYLVLICLTILVICSILTDHERVKQGLPEEQWNGAKPTNNYQSELMKRKAMQDLKDELNGLPEVICSIPMPKYTSPEENAAWFKNRVHWIGRLRFSLYEEATEEEKLAIIDKIKRSIEHTSDVWRLDNMIGFPEIGKPPKKINPLTSQETEESIINKACRYYGFDMADLDINTRTKLVVSYLNKINKAKESEEEEFPPVGSMMKLNYGDGF